LLEKTVEKGGLKVAEKVGLGNAFKDWQEGGKGVQGLANAAKGAIGRQQSAVPASSTAAPDVPAETPLSSAPQASEEAPQALEEASSEAEQLGEQVQPEDLIDAAKGVQAAQDSATTASVREAAGDLLKTLSQDTPKASTPPAPESVPEAPAGAAPEAEEAASNLTPAVEKGLGDAAKTTESTLAKATAASSEDDFNPVGLLVTAGLAIGTLFAGIFGHHRDGLPKHPPVPPPVINASTQFGVSQ